MQFIRGTRSAGAGRLQDNVDCCRSEVRVVEDWTDDTDCSAAIIAGGGTESSYKTLVFSVSSENSAG